MKRILLDTHVLLWWLVNDPALGVKAKAVIADSRNEVYVSSATNWEISIKSSLGKLVAPIDMAAVVEDEVFLALPITPYHGDQAGRLPGLHRDPFDRMLIAQAQAEGLVLITNDSSIKQYTVQTIDASQ